MVELAAEALEELAEALLWYHEQRAGLGDELLAEVDQAMAAIGAMPAAFSRLRDVPPELHVRRSLLKRFPFALVFVQLPDGPIRVIAVAHVKRRPGYWLRRVVG